MRTRTSSVIVAALVGLGITIPVAAQTPARPRLGVALGGGAAKGIAHIGVLAWLEEHRIPVDLVAGTSMGGLIGGAYATGLSIDELRALMRDMDWDLVFLSDSPFQYKSFRRKEDARAFPAQIEFGLRGGLQLPGGMNPGQQIQLTLDRIAAPYHAIASFDDLPLPFRCVAVDLLTRRQVILDSGSLATALRATMALPGIFTPVARNGALLVDGGVLNNVPADVVRAMGAEIVVAVNVGSAPPDPSAQASLFTVMGQTIDVMMAAGVERTLASADVVVSPELGDLSGMDWHRATDFEAVGYAAAEAVRDQLIVHALSVEAYAAWQAARQARRVALPPAIDYIRFEGVPGWLSEPMARRVTSTIVGRPFDPDDLTTDVLRLTGSDRFAVVRYGLESRGSETGVLVTAEEKSYGPPFLHPSLDLETTGTNDLALNARARLVLMDVIGPQSEVRIDGTAGTRYLLAAEVYRHIGTSPVFAAARASWGRRTVDIYVDRDLIAEYREGTTGVGVDIGASLGSQSEVRLGYDVERVRLGLRIGLPSFPEVAGLNRVASLRWAFDGQTSPMIPTRGLHVTARLGHYIDTPDLTGTTPQDGPTGYQQGEVQASWFTSVHGRHRVFLGGAAGSNFGRDPGYNAFELGGLLRLGALHPGERRTPGYALGQGGLLYQVIRLPEIVGSNGYLGAWLESGTTFDQGVSRTDWQVSGGFVLETILGPVFIGGSSSLHDRDGRFYINIGRFVR